ncbi:PAP2 superfamily protein [Xylariales sp. AK1849]|nr:PAP2 superfamily protein [Xylariales sp. AK1849]
MGLPTHRRKPQVPSNVKHKAWFRHSEPYTIEKRPSFGQWLKATILDIVTMMVLGIITLAVFRAGPAGTRTFPLTVTNTGEVVYPQFAYPYRAQYVPPWLATLLAVVVPIAFILLAQIRIRSFWDINNGIIGLIYALEGSQAFQVMLKWLVGGLRPNFYDVRKPDPSLASQDQFNASGLNGVGYQNYMFTAEICTEGLKEGIDNALASFPSGHSTTIFAGMVYLSLYMNSKLKVFSNYHPAMWKLVLLYCPILGACLVGGSLTVDQSHNWYDVVAGGTIGTIFAFSSYRMVYAAIWDFHKNHIPLNRGSAFAWGKSVVGYHMVFTKRAGWREDVPPTGTKHAGPSSGSSIMGGIQDSPSPRHRQDGAGGPRRAYDMV